MGWNESSKHIQNALQEEWPRKQGIFRLEREDLEGHTKCLQIFAGLDTVCITPEGIISEHGLTMLRNQL